MTSSQSERSGSKAGSETAERSIELIVRDLRGLLTPLDRRFDEIDRIILSQLLDELGADRERDKELADDAKMLVIEGLVKLQEARDIVAFIGHPKVRDGREKAYHLIGEALEILHGEAALSGEGQAGEGTSP